VVNSWNTPYIDTDETLQLFYGMPKEEVLSILGNPLYVEKGWPNGATNEIVWVYEVRTQYVASTVSTTGQITIVKTPSSRKPNRPGFVLHKLKITFKDGKISHWEPLKENKKTSLKPTPHSDNSSEADTKTTISSSKKAGWSIQPKISRVFETWDGYNYGGWDYNEISGDNSGMRPGLNISKPLSSLNINVGLDISTGYGSGFMLFAEKALGPWRLALSFGNDVVEEVYEQKGSFKIGIFRDLGKFLYGFERLGRKGGGLEGTSTFLTLRYNLAK